MLIGYTLLRYQPTFLIVSWAVKLISTLENNSLIGFLKVGIAYYMLSSEVVLFFIYTAIYINFNNI